MTAPEVFESVPLTVRSPATPRAYEEIAKVPAATLSAPLIVVVPPKLIVVPRKTAEPAVNVLEKPVVPVAALVWVRALVMVTAAEKVSAAELVMVKAVNAVVPPTMPVKPVVPVPEFTIKVPAPLVVLPMLIFPAPAAP